MRTKYTKLEKWKCPKIENGLIQLIRMKESTRLTCMWFKGSETKRRYSPRTFAKILSYMYLADTHKQFQDGGSGLRLNDRSALNLFTYGLATDGMSLFRSSVVSLVWLAVLFLLGAIIFVSPRFIWFHMVSIEKRFIWFQLRNSLYGFIWETVYMVSIEKRFIWFLYTYWVRKSLWKPM